MPTWPSSTSSVWLRMWIVAYRLLGPVDATRSD